jgi:hypothetical protein
MNRPFAIQQYRQSQRVNDVVATGSGASLEIAGLQNNSHSRQSAPSLSPLIPNEPGRLIRAFAGKTAGKRRLEISRFATRSEERVDVKGDFHEAEITVKHDLKHLFIKSLENQKMNLKRLKTMATASNHTVCGAICGQEWRLIWPG